MHHPTDRMVHITAFVKTVVENWLELEIVQWIQPEGSIRQPSHHERTFYHGATSRYIPNENGQLILSKTNCGIKENATCGSGYKITKSQLALGQLIGRWLRRL